ncbi:hypothetical protein [Streptomyces sp. NPDC001635]
MSPALALIQGMAAQPTVVDPMQVLEARVELIACGIGPGKVEACDSHRGSGAVLLWIASTGAVDALAAAICDSTRGPACIRCDAKAQEIVRLYNEGTGQ